MLGLLAEFLIQGAWDGAQEVSFLTSSHYAAGPGALLWGPLMETVAVKSAGSGVRVVWPLCASVLSSATRG